jgi:hypothetical protein
MSSDKQRTKDPHPSSFLFDKIVNNLILRLLIVGD